jgi:hypothetical protein
LEAKMAEGLPYNPNAFTPGVDQENLDFLEAISVGPKAYPPAPKPFLGDYRTLDTTARSMVENPSLPFEAKIQPLSYLAKIEERKKAVEDAKKAEEASDLESVANNYNSYIQMAEKLGIPKPPPPARLQSYFDAQQKAKEAEQVNDAQSLVGQRNALDANTSQANVSVSGNGFDGEYLGRLTPGYEQQKQGLKMAADAGQKKAVETASYYETLEKNLQENEARRLQNENQRQQDVDAQLREYTLLADDLKKSEVDPKKYWKDQGAFGQILGALSIGLGAYAQGRGAGPNGALQIINAAIDRDVAAQRDEIAKKKGLVDAKSNLLQMMRQKFGDDRMAEAATRSYLMETTKLKLDQIASKYQGQELQANRMQLSGALDVAMQKDAMAMQKLASEIAENKAKSANLNADKYVPGLQQYALTADAAKTLKEATKARNDVMDGVSKLKNMRAQYGSEFLNRNVVGRAKVIATDMLLKYKNIAQLGVMSDSDKELLDQLIPKDPTQFEWTGSTFAQLDEFQKIVDRGFRNLALSEGLDPSKAIQSSDIKQIQVGGETVTVMKRPDGKWEEVK